MTLSKTSTHSMVEVTIFFRNGSSFASLEELEISNRDKIVISINCGGLTAVMTNTYVKPDNRDKLQRRLIQGFVVCRKYADSNELDGVVFFGDWNARLFYWGDHFCNQLWHDFNNVLPILASWTTENQPSTRSMDNSVNDLCICYGNFINKYVWNLTIDEENELFTGAPSRRHFSVKLTPQIFVKLKVNEKPWIEKALWDEWTNHMEIKIMDFSEKNPDASCMEEYVRRSMKDATKLFLPNKKLQIIVNRSGATN